MKPVVIESEWKRRPMRTPIFVVGAHDDWTDSPVPVYVEYPGVTPGNRIRCPLTLREARRLRNALDVAIRDVRRREAQKAAA